jgi:hypothetical protein
MTGTENRDADVVVVGGGPVGMGLAIDLGRRGVSCVVVERYAEPQPIPKGQNLTQRTLEHFYFWGIEQDLRAARTIPKAYGIGGLTAYGTLLSPYTYDWMQRELVRPYYFTDNERLPQYATEAVLRRRAAALPAFEHSMGAPPKRSRRIETASTSWSRIGRQASGGRSVAPSRSDATEAGRWCGSKAHITQTRSDHDRKMVLLVFRSHELHVFWSGTRENPTTVSCIPTSTGTGSSSARRSRHHMVLPCAGARRHHEGQLRFPRVSHAAVGAEFDVAFDHIGFWDLRIASADRYRNGRSSSQAMRLTATRPMAATASTRGWRMRSI